MELENTIKAELNQFHKHYFSHMENSREAVTRDQIAPVFYSSVATTAIRKKDALRTMLSKHPAWDEEHQMVAVPVLVDLDEEEVTKRKFELIGGIYDLIDFEEPCNKNRGCTWDAIRWFCREEEDCWLDALKKEFPKQYHEGKKITRIMRGCCKELGIDKKEGFEKLFAEFADLLTPKTQKENLYISINPAHFLSMSNPKYDDRGWMMTSCHSFNSTEYRYNNGCTGYINDDCTMIAFTVADEKNEETFFNRKTSRQLFMYKDGVIVQSRLYNTSGGTNSNSARVKTYREAVQKVISECTDLPNKWKTMSYKDNDYGFDLYADYEFGGYTDWTYREFNAKLSINKTLIDENGRANINDFTAGGAGICAGCGEYLIDSDGIFCEVCMNERRCFCEFCGEYCEETYTAYDENDDPVEVCSDCLEENYFLSDYDREYYPTSIMVELDGVGEVTEPQRDEHYVECECCGDWILERNSYLHEDPETGVLTTRCHYCNITNAEVM